MAKWRAILFFLLGASACTCYAADFRFAWLSDTHVGSTTGEDDLRLAVQDINAMTNVSFAVISGDITEYGSRQQLLLAKEILGGLKVPLHVIPGNHDTKWSESGATDFPRIFGNDRFVFDYGGYRFIGMHEGPLMKMGDGFFSPQDLRWLDQMLGQCRDGRPPIVFVTHYPLNDGIANWFEVLDRLKKVNAQAVLVGHGHTNCIMDYEGAPGVMGRSNLRARRPAGGFTIVDITAGVMKFSEHTNGGDGAAQWYSLPLVPHHYAADTNPYPRPDFQVNNLFPQVKPRWQFHTGYTIASAPALWQDLGIIGDASGTVYALKINTGKVRWQFKAKDAIYSTPDVAQDRVVFASTDGAVYALKAASGTLDWVFRTDRPIVASPRIAGDVVYIGSSEGKFRALDLHTGKLLWQFTEVTGFVETRPLFYDGKIFFGAWDGHFYALNAKTGKRVWSWKGDKAGTLLSPAACWPVAAEGKVFIVAPDRKMTALDAETGNIVWRTGDYAVRESIGLSQDGRQIFVRTMNDYFYAFATAPKRPTELWRCNAGFGYDINSAMLVEKNGTVFYGTKNGVLFALNGLDGTIQWEHKIGTGVMNTVAAVDPHRVLVSDFDGTVALLEQKF